jgi:hypothetical protein
MCCEARIDPVDAIGRQSRQARRQAADIQDNLAIEAGAETMLSLAHATSALQGISTFRRSVAPFGGWLGQSSGVCSFLQRIVFDQISFSSRAFDCPQIIDAPGDRRR